MVRIKQPATTKDVSNAIFAVASEPSQLYHTNCDGQLIYISHQSEFWCNKCHHNLDAMKMDEDFINKYVYVIKEDLEKIWKIVYNSKGGYFYTREATPEETEHYHRNKEPANLEYLFK